MEVALSFWYFILPFWKTSCPKKVVKPEKLDILGQEWLHCRWMMGEVPFQDHLDNVWGAISQLKLAEGSHRFPTVSKLKAFMCIPHSNASSERAFSMLTKVAMEFRSELGHDALCAIMALNFNEDQCCHPNMVMDATLLEEATCVYNRPHSSSKSDR